MTDGFGRTGAFVLFSAQAKSGSGEKNSSSLNPPIIVPTFVLLVIVPVLLFLWRQESKTFDRGNLNYDGEAEFQDEGEKLFNSRYDFDVAFGLQLYSTEGLGNQSDLFHHDAEELLRGFLVSANCELIT
jgi:hypothetical protein